MHVSDAQLRRSPRGGSGRDRLFGDDGNDKLFEQDGERDVLAGGVGDDTSLEHDAKNVRNEFETIV